MAKFSDLLDQKNILDIRICELAKCEDLSLERSWLAPLISKLYRELSSKGLDFKPEVWVSDDWFSPDGSAGFALPFFLLHPELMKLERQAKGEVEGSTLNWAMKLLRHETGHALDNAYRLRRNKTRQRIFGLSSQDYPDDYDVQPFSKKYVRHLNGHYAQAHPDEDWAETFATWLTPKSNWRTKYKNWPAIEKLNFVNQVMKSLDSTNQNTKVKKVDHWSKDKRTLREFFNERSKKYARKVLLKERKLKRDISPILTNSMKVNAYQFLKVKKSILKKQLRRELGESSYRIDCYLKDLSRTSRRENLYFSTKNQKQLLQILSQSAKSYIIKGNHKVLM
ncbi:MAG: hypothetical protein GY909_18825 [Oligoflexia bacterium]|nr:hypothetical protein [Oligoflexia bacterium]